MNSHTQLPSPGDPAHPLRLSSPGNALPVFPRAAGIPAGPPDDDDVIDLKDYWRILVRRRRIIAISALVAAVLAVIVTFNSTPVYRSTLLMQIERQGNQIVDYGSVMPEERSFFASQDFYTTQYELLKSRTLARRVIDQLGLEVTDDRPPSLIGRMVSSAKGLVSLVMHKDDRSSGQSTADLERIERMREEDAFEKNLEIEPVPDSKLVRVHYDSPDPADAAAVANAVAKNFINLNLERRFDASAYAKQFLEEQLQQMRTTLEGSEKRFVAYAREREIVNLDDRLEIMLSKLREMNSQLVLAEAERIKAEAEYQELLESTGGSAPDILESPLVQTLKQRRGELLAQYQDNLQVYKPGYPKMVQLQRQIDELSDEITREASSISGAVKARYEARVREEAKLRERIRELKEEALALQDRSTDYETLRREVETNRELYDGLLQRMKEVGVAAGVGENNISIVDPATVPLYPYKPSLQKNLAIALALGLLFGVALAFLLETLDDTLKTAEEIERRAGAPVLSLIPHASTRSHGIANAEIPLLAFKDPKSAVAEAVRSLRTSLMFSTGDGAPSILHFTSARPGEGKTTAAVSTAIAFAQAGGKVLLIDADLRNPSLHRAFMLPNTLGLTNRAIVSSFTNIRGL